MKQWETERQGAIARAEKKREDASTLAKRIEALTVTITAKAGNEGHLFGSIGRGDVLAALTKEGIALDKKSIELADPIRQVGQATVPLRLAAGVQASLKVNVVAEPS